MGCLTKMTNRSSGEVRRTRVILKQDTSSVTNNILRTKTLNKSEIREFKAISIVTGFSRKSKEIQVKRLGHTLASLAIPGDSDPIRSPVRSAFYRTITPGKPGVGGSKPGQNRGYRCPEGYQFGGRFTDSRLSTCGAKLFDIPSPLGLAIGALTRMGKGPKGKPASGRILGAGEYIDSPVISRAPNVQIPKVSTANNASRAKGVAEMVRQLGGVDTRNSRLVRRDGFVLQPVVPTSVLRAIPDNRDMEGATFIQSALGQTEFGRDELGLLSNTGVNQLLYVTPGGNTFSLQKVRELTVGERRKLGRTVNTANSIDVSTDPTARLKYVANETGDGIRYSENFPKIKNPHQMIFRGGKNREKWVEETFGGKRNRMKPIGTSNLSTRETETFAGIKGKIDSVDEAIAHINNGGNLSDISPTILAKVLATNGVSKETRLSANASMIQLGSRKYIYNKRPSKYEALSERFSEDVQQFLGLESPDVLLVGNGDNRKYLREDAQSALLGSSLDRNATWKDFSPEDVAKLLVADLVTDQRVRTSDSVVALRRGDKTVPMAVTNVSGGLMSLDKIAISKRQKMKVDELLSSALMSEYSKYYRELRADQQAQMRRYISQLLSRAKKFSVSQYRSRLSNDGKLSEGEKIHIDILGKLFQQRVEQLSNSGQLIRDGLSG